MMTNSHLETALYCETCARGLESYIVELDHGVCCKCHAVASYVLPVIPECPGTDVSITQHADGTLHWDGGTGLEGAPGAAGAAGDPGCYIAPPLNVGIPSPHSVIQIQVTQLRWEYLAGSEIMERVEIWHADRRLACNERSIGITGTGGD